MGTGLVRRANTLRIAKHILTDEQRSSQLDDLVRALEDQDSNIEALMKLELQLQLLAQSAPPNILPLQKKNAFRPLRALHTITDHRHAIQTTCLIEGQDHAERRKVALEIHSRTARTVFLDFNKDLVSLEDSSLFIAEIAELSVLDQKSIERALQNPSSPLFISGTQYSMSHLRAHPLLDPKILDLLSVSRFRLQHPLKHYLEHGFFKLFLESLY